MQTRSGLEREFVRMHVSRGSVAPAEAALWDALLVVWGGRSFERAPHSKTAGGGRAALAGGGAPAPPARLPFTGRVTVGGLRVTVVSEGRRFTAFT